MVDVQKGPPFSTVYAMSSNPKWGDYLENNLSYPEDYSPAYFYRQINVQQVSNPSLDYAPYLYQVTVTVLWNEGRTADLAKPDRMKKIQLSTIVLDERRGY